MPVKPRIEFSDAGHVLATGTAVSGFIRNLELLKVNLQRLTVPPELQEKWNATMLEIDAALVWAEALRADIEEDARAQIAQEGTH